MNTIIKIGMTGMYTCYLNVPIEECKRRYCEQNSVSLETLEGYYNVESYTFTDEFAAYDVYNN